MTPEEIVERAAEVLAEHVRVERRAVKGSLVHYRSECECGHELPWRDWYEDLRAHQAQALADAGLLPTEVEWAVRGRRFVNVRRYGEDGYDFKTRGEAERHASQCGDDTHVVWRATAGPWTEVTP